MAEIELGSLRAKRSKAPKKSLAERRAEAKKAKAAALAQSKEKARSKPEQKRPPRKKLPATAEDRASQLATLKAAADAACDGVIERFDPSSEEARQLDQYRHMFDELVDISSILEANIKDRKSSRDVYPLMQTYNQMREVIADMRALRDLGKLGDRVNEELIYPMVQSIGQDIAQFYQDLNADLRRILPAHEADIVMAELGTQFSGLGSKIKLAYDQCLDKSARVLGS